MHGSNVDLITGKGIVGGTIALPGADLKPGAIAPRIKKIAEAAVPTKRIIEFQL